MPKLDNVTDLVERQIRLIEAKSRALAEIAERERPHPPYPFVTISQLKGSGGIEIAQLVAKRLGWCYLDRAIIDYVAQESRIEKRLLELLDERSLGEINAWLQSLFYGRFVDEYDYIKRVNQVLHAFISHDPAVIVGRGSYILLSRYKERGLRVCIIAPEEKRVARVKEEEGVSWEEARHLVRQADEDQRDFMRALFGRPPHDPYLFDLTLNIDHLTVDQGVEIIISALRAKGLLSLEAPCRGEAKAK